MQPSTQGKARRSHQRMYPSDNTSGNNFPVRRFNALTHGLNSGYVLLPGDDVSAFRKQRRRLFEQYQPRTVEEAQCVEVIAAGLWRLYRAGLEQTGFEQHLGAVMDGHPDFTGRAGDPDPHRLHHRGTDSSREATRWLRSLRHTRAELALMQKQRVERPTAGLSASLEPYTVFMAEGEPVVPWETGAEAEASDLDSAASTPATHSPNKRTRENRERDADASPRFPKHWSRRQRTAAARRAEQRAAPLPPPDSP